MGTGGCITSFRQLFFNKFSDASPLVTIWAQMVPCGHRSSWFAHLEGRLTREEGEEEEFTAAQLDSGCRGQCTAESTLGFASLDRTSDTSRSLRACRGVMYVYHSLDKQCRSGENGELASQPAAGAR